MKGYVVDSGYMGYVPSAKAYKLFPTEDEYVEWYRETQVEISYAEWCMFQ